MLIIRRKPATSDAVDASVSHETTACPGALFSAETFIGGEGGAISLGTSETLSEKELSAIIKDYGQERWHSRIARYLVSERVKHPIETTQELREIILRAIPYRNYKEKIHPATRTFQAFRIAVNRELEALEVALDRCVASLKPNGRIAVIAFHSLEDKIVKEKFRSMARAGQVRLLVKKPLRPSEQESTQNPRARSARLRIAERI